MNTIEWSDALLLDFEPMDRFHREFVDLLALAQLAPDDALPQAWSAVLEHTTLRFAQEDDWMHTTRFVATENHLLQHRLVLKVLREGLVMARAGDLPPVREMTGELAAWFAKHTPSLDAALALHLRNRVAAPRAGRAAAAQPERIPPH